MYSQAMGYWTNPGLFHVIAHQGASAYAPGNSLEAFALASQHSATDVEVDVHCTIDGQFVIRHDAVIGPAPSSYISELSHDDYRAICDRNSKPSLSLARAITVAKQNNLGIYLDIKQVLPGKLPDLVDIIRDSGYQEKIVLASFRTDIAREIKERGPDLLTSVLFHDPNLDFNSLVRGVGCDFLHPCFDIFADPLKFFSTQWVARLRTTGAGLIAWNITTPEMADLVIRMNPQGACADDPQILVDALARLKR